MTKKYPSLANPDSAKSAYSLDNDEAAKAFLEGVSAPSPAPAHEEKAETKEARFTVVLPVEDIRAIRLEAARRGITMKALIQEFARGLKDA